MIEYIVNTFVFVFGSALGEFLANKIFGTPRKSGLYLLEIFAFVFVAIFFLANLNFSQINTLMLFFIGAYASIAARALSTIGGFFSLFLEKRRRYEIEPILKNLFELLRKRGLKQIEIEEILITAGFNPKDVRKISHSSFSSSPFSPSSSFAKTS